MTQWGSLFEEYIYILCNCVTYVSDVNMSKIRSQEFEFFMTSDYLFRNIETELKMIAFEKSS